MAFTNSEILLLNSGKDLSYIRRAVVKGVSLFVAEQIPLRLCHQPLEGVACQFFNATYRATVNYKNGTQSSRTEVIARRELLNVDAQMQLQDYNMHRDGAVPLKASPLANANMAAIVDAYTNAFKGMQHFNPSFSTQAPSPGLFVWDNNPPPLFQWDDEAQLSLRSDISSLKEGLQSLMGNVTLSLMTLNLDRSIVSAEIYSHRNTYKFHALTLGLTYGLAFLLAGIATLLGVRALKNNGRPRDLIFSEFLVTTHNRSLDRWANSGWERAEFTDEELKSPLKFNGRWFEPCIYISIIARVRVCIRSYDVPV